MRRVSDERVLFLAQPTTIKPPLRSTAMRGHEDLIRELRKACPCYEVSTLRGVFCLVAFLQYPSACVRTSTRRITTISSAIAAPRPIRLLWLLLYVYVYYTTKCTTTAGRTGNITRIIWATAMIRRRGSRSHKRRRSLLPSVRVLLLYLSVRLTTSALRVRLR